MPDARSPREGFVGALVSEEPSHELPAAARIFEPFIGSWRLLVRWFDAEGDVIRERQGEWHFERVLEGRGIQDVWIVPPRGSRGHDDDYEYGTSIRFYDPQLDTWRSTWIGPMHRVVRTFTANAVDGKVVLRTTAGELPEMRWSFSDIGPERFRWTNEVRDHGAWRVQQTFEAQREG